MKEGTTPVAEGQVTSEENPTLVTRLSRIWRVKAREDQVADEHVPRSESKSRKEAVQENLLVIVVLIFSFIYFLFQIYAWFATPQ